MLRLGVRGHDVTRTSFEDLVCNIGKQGFCCTQLALKKAVTEFNVNIEAMTSGMAFYMKDVFARNKVEVSVLGCYLNLATPDIAQLEATIKTYEAHIRFANLLSCGVVGTETGAVNVNYEFEEANHSEEALNIFIKNLKRVVSYAEKMGVTVAVEPVYKHIMCDIKRTRKVLDAIDSPNLRVIFDPVNVFNPENYKRQDEIIMEAFDLLKDEIEVLHIKDFIINNGEMSSSNLVVGDGLLNLSLIMKLAKQYKPFIHMLLEDSTPDNALLSKVNIEKAYHLA